mmetsp:Transcript_53044/g.113938  ORF Transcript_53044/g.113938 Transcript_53044/m.113938 type:complete len:250 (-) Transcript_53044:1030-1779(-)
MCLDERIEGHGIRNARCLHATHELLSSLQVTALDASVEGGVPEGVRQLRTAGLKRAEGPHGFIEVAPSRTAPDHGDVLRRVRRGCFQQRSGNILASALERSGNDALLSARVDEATPPFTVAATAALQIGVVYLAHPGRLFSLAVEASQHQEGRDLPSLIWPEALIESVGERRVACRGAHREHRRHGFWSAIRGHAVKQLQDALAIPAATLHEQPEGAAVPLCARGGGQRLPARGQSRILRAGAFGQHRV